MPSPESSAFPVPLEREPGIDGLRGYGVMMVALFHSGLTPDDTGAYTIGAFFVISGFVITRQVLHLWSTGQEFRPSHFLGQRLIRLYPSLIITVVATTIWVWFVGPTSGRANAPGSATAALTHTFNFYLLNTDATGYGRLFTARSPWSHLWSVSIEEQFYVVFAIAMFVVLRSASPQNARRRVMTTLAVAAVGFTVIQIFTAVRTESVAVAYLRTDSRISEFVIGSLAGAAFASGKLARFRGPVVCCLGLVYLGGLTAIWYLTPRNHLSSYLGGFQLHALLVVFVAWTACVAGPFKQIIGSRALRRLGLWSYAIYLLHWPAIIIAQNLARSAEPQIALLGVASSIALAAFLTRWIEQPIRRRGRNHPGRYLTLIGVSGVLACALSLGLGRSWSFEQRINPKNDGRKANVTEPPVGDRRPHTVMLSDSVGDVILGSLSKLEPSTVWVDRVQTGCILSEDEIWWIGGWQPRSTGDCPGILERTAAELRPIDTVIFAFGNGDSRERRRGDEVFSVETREGASRVRAELDGYLQTLVDTGASVVAVDIGPSMSFDATGVEAVTPSQAKAWNRVLTDLVSDKFPQVEIVPLHKLLATSYRPRAEVDGCALRGTDGFHLSQCGGDMAARMVLQTLGNS